MTNLTPTQIEKVENFFNKNRESDVRFYKIQSIPKTLIPVILEILNRPDER